MVVLSLFDGISCGRVALERAGVKVDKYFASEIDEGAINISKDNYPDIICIGNVEKVRYSDGVLYTEYGDFKTEIDIVIGGFPCQAFSFSGKRLSFDDPRGKLFFEFHRLITETKPKYFLGENVRMNKETEKIISDTLGVQPVFINSSLVSCQDRKRLYWTNIKFDMPKKKEIYLKDIIDYSEDDESLFISSEFDHNLTLKEDSGKVSDTTIRLGGYNKQGQGQRVYSINGKSVSLSALGGGWGAKTGLYLVNDRIRKLSQREAEIAQTLPVGYTSSAGWSQAIKGIGNGWTVDIIENFFRNI